ncbi:PhoX family protein [Caldimonas brevitalea]|uniref:dTDP-glucose 4,6-dehydratase n=1 Tax=Caldimonas brevitalea TaxID=413882 RepID=A0A0G3BLE4_9BURK|nr:PhoX family phosphatase [Caldimonas brevitalea]AKJ27345.1 dTDP-glucose 4,6-dehydratase [Caldimonas brevitalea]
MSYITDRLRAEFAAAMGRKESAGTVPGQMFEDVLRDAQVQRRSLLKGSLGATIAAAFGSGLLTACGGGDDDDAAPAPAPAPGPAPADSYDVTFSKIDKATGAQVVVPANYTVEVMYAAGDACVAGSAAFAGSFFGSGDTEKMAGGQHDGMHFFEIPGVDPNKGGLLAINHEAPEVAVLFPALFEFKPETATAEQKKLALSSVGVSVIEVAVGADGKWAVKKDSKYNKRYTGNSTYNVSGPAKSAVGNTVIGTLNNCSSGHTPWGTYLTCEETTNNYLDPSQAEEGYGWVVEIDPLGQLSGLPVKRTALGRFDHENTAYLMGADNRVAFYLGDDSTPGCVYKFVPNGKVDLNNRAANANLLDDGVLYAAKFNADGTGQWLPLVQGQSGLTAGAVDPGNETQGAADDETIDFLTQADVLLNTKAAARVAGATLMDRPEWVTVGLDKKIYMTLTNNGGRTVTDPANPRVSNKHGHIVQWTEAGDAPTATTFKWELFLLAGDPSLAEDNLKGNIVGDTFSSPDGLRVDPQGRLWVQTDASTSASTTSVFGNNAMYYVDQKSRASRRFLVGPDGCEITGLAYTPDLKTFFINIQHPSSALGAWPSNQPGQNPILPGRSATIVVRHKEAKPVGA